MKKLQQELENILTQYQQSFSAKSYNEENNEIDILMQLFGITPEIKRENRQYWGRELGMCWQLLVSKTAEINCFDFAPAMRIDADEPTDLMIGKDAIDTKYRIGSGDSGTLKKFKKYGRILKEKGYNPTLLILREDNLPAAIKACEVGGWKIYTGQDTFNYIQERTSFDLYQFLSNLSNNFGINRSL